MTDAALVALCFALIANSCVLVVLARRIDALRLALGWLTAPLPAVTYTAGATGSTNFGTSMGESGAANPVGPTSGTGGASAAADEPKAHKTGLIGLS